MKIFLDTNILLDVAQGRESFYEASSNIVQFAHRDDERILSLVALDGHSFLHSAETLGRT